MFSFFNHPFYYRPTYCFQNPWHSRRKVLFERYLDALDQRFFSILTDDDDAVQLLDLEHSTKPVNISTIETPKIETKPEETQMDVKSDDVKIDSQPVQSKDHNPWLGRQYVSHTRRTFNGKNYVEEDREKVTESDGQTRIATRRRLGDRWYENETHIDKDGKKTERETWHNVGDEDIEQFKLEWSQKQSCQTKSSNDDLHADSHVDGDADHDAPLVTDPANPSAVESAAGSNERGESMNE
jgi:hypothetical protein